MRRFEVDGLADVIVIAGPNGVGKSRLLQRLSARLQGAGVEAKANAIVSATCPEERTAWGKDRLDLSIAQDSNLLHKTLNASRFRKRWKSSLVNFESDRTIQTLKPLAFTFDLVDPDEEPVQWNSTFGYFRDRFQDTVHAMFRMIEVQKQGIASQAIKLKREGHKEMALGFNDPMEEFKNVFSMLLSPKQLVDPSARTQKLEYIVDGEVREFPTLSSGEREVVNIAFDFLLRRPEDCIVFFDEPELHLHPELSYKLLQTLATIGARNQFVLSTHSPDIITATLDQSVIFLSPPRSSSDGSPANQAITVNSSDETHQALRLLGQSVGIVALGRRIVLVEGDESSLDKQTYGSILRHRYPGLVLVPSGGKHVLESFDTIFRAVLSRTIWGIEFMMLCDRDSRPIESDNAAEARAQGRLRVLPRYHLENYFLDEFVWSEAFAQMEPPDSWLRDPAQIRKALLKSAAHFVSYAAALSASHELRQLAGNIDVMPKACHDKSLDQLKDLIVNRVHSERSRVDEVLTPERVVEAVERAYMPIKAAVDSDSEEWKSLVPGKQVVAAFAAGASLLPSRAKTLYVGAAAKSGRAPFLDIFDIFDEFAGSSTSG